jgi:hypothetical protein
VVARLDVIDTILILIYIFYKKANLQKCNRNGLLFTGERSQSSTHCLRQDSLSQTTHVIFLFELWVWFICIFCIYLLDSEGQARTDDSRSMVFETGIPNQGRNFHCCSTAPFFIIVTAPASAQYCDHHSSRFGRHLFHQRASLILIVSFDAYWSRSSEERLCALCCTQGRQVLSRTWVSVLEVVPSKTSTPGKEVRTRAPAGRPSALDHPQWCVDSWQKVKFYGSVLC